MDYPDPEDFLDQDDYDLYENRFQDEFEMMEEFENENTTKKKNDKVDFTVENKTTKTANELDRSLLKGSLKRTSTFLESDDDELMYSDEEDKKKESSKGASIKENNSPMKEKCTKKLKFDEPSPPSETTTPQSLASKELSDLRQRLQGNIEDDADDFDEQQYNNTRQRVFRRPLLGYDMVNVTNTEGDRVFLKLSPDTEHEKSKVTFRDTDGRLNLLSVPFEDLLSEVNEKRHQNLIQRRAINSSDRRVPDIRGTKDLALWVDKYSPHKYTELLSDDGTNRLLLKWLKLWDNVVFHEGKAINTKRFTNNNNNNKFQNKDGGFKKQDGGKFKRRDFTKSTFATRQAILEEELVHDKKGRPKMKIALLCGNPGLGKTTLAHVISKHAGYNVIEMNASDDRSTEIFRNRIESSVQMKATVTGHKKPNCLIIDEIDGAPAAAINILTELCKTTDNAGNRKGAKGKKKKKKDFILNRPIICICNDLYVPALRQLRQASFVLNFPSTLASRLANRLLMISQTEEMIIDMGSLLLLAEKTENDIRSCLNTLQFVKQQGKELKQDDIKKLDVGQKDMKKGVRTIIQGVFQLPRVNRKKLIGDMNNRGVNVKTGASARFHHMLHTVSGNTDYEKTMQGLFDQYLHCKTKDPYLESITKGGDWLCFADLVQERVQHDQSFVLRKYSVFLPVAFHMFFAKATPFKLQYSNVSYENFVKTQTNKQTLQLMLSGMSPYVRRHCLGRPTLLELVPYLFLMTAPNLRPVNTKLYSEMEKRMFISLVETMISYNLTFRQERNQDGQHTYILEPNIEELIAYSNMPQHKHLPYATKQLIAREIDLEKMRKHERNANALEQPNFQSKPKKGTESQQQQQAKKPQVSAQTIVKRQKLIPKKIEKESTQLDFFGRVIKTPVKGQGGQGAGKEKEENSLLSKTIRFRFNEGYTNAVRRKVKVKDFF